MLYEEAVARQWSSATDIPWETIQPLPDDTWRLFPLCAPCLAQTDPTVVSCNVPEDRDGERPVPQQW